MPAPAASARPRPTGAGKRRLLAQRLPYSCERTALRRTQRVQRPAMLQGSHARSCQRHWRRFVRRSCALRACLACICSGWKSLGAPTSSAGCSTTLTWPKRQSRSPPFGTSSPVPPPVLTSRLARTGARPFVSMTRRSRGVPCESMGTLLASARRSYRFCMCCGLSFKTPHVLHRATPMLQYGFETGVDVCRSCHAAQQVLDVVAMEREVRWPQLEL